MFSLNWKAPQGSYIYMLFLSCCFCITKPIVVEPSEIRPSLTYLLTYPFESERVGPGGAGFPAPHLAKKGNLYSMQCTRKKFFDFMVETVENT